MSTKLRPVAESAPLSPRKEAVRRHYDRLAVRRDGWIERNTYFHAEDRRCTQFMVPEGLRVLDLGCGTGHLLAALKPSLGAGLDISPRMIEAAQRNYPHARHPNLRFEVGDVEEGAVLDALEAPFDIVLMSDTIGLLEDIEATLARLHRL